MGVGLENIIVDRTDGKLLRRVPDGVELSFETVVAYIERDGRFLLLLRREDKSFGGTWGMPGGKVNPGETRRQALRRELKEETGYDFLEEDFHSRLTLYVEHYGKKYLYSMYRVNADDRVNLDGIDDPILRPAEHDDFTWVTPEESFTLNTVPLQVECTTEMYCLH